MPILNSQSADQFGFDNMRGNSIRNVGRPRKGTDAMTWASPSFTSAEIALIPNATAGMIIFNSTTSKHQGYDGSAWNNLY